MRTLIIGNGDGIGLALTKRLLREGQEVIGVSRRRLDRICDRHLQHVLDVLDPEFPKSMAAIVAMAGKIDTLVYCAGIGEPFETSGVDCDGDTIRVNLAALADAARAVLPAMLARRDGRIIGLQHCRQGSARRSELWRVKSWNDRLSARTASRLAQIGSARECRSFRIR